MVTTRFFQSSDYDAVKALLLEAGLFSEEWESKENLAGMIAKDPQAILVAIENEQIVGSVFLVPYGTKIMHLYRLAVKKEFRKQGIASLLLEEVQKIAKAKGYIEIDLYADAENDQLRQFYAKRGFVSSAHSYFALWKEF